MATQFEGSVFVTGYAVRPWSVFFKKFWQTEVVKTEVVSARPRCLHMATHTAVTYPSPFCAQCGSPVEWEDKKIETKTYVPKDDSKEPFRLRHLTTTNRIDWVEEEVHWFEIGHSAKNPEESVASYGAYISWVKQQPWWDDNEVELVFYDGKSIKYNEE